jgi:hypothetical protein
VMAFSKYSASIFIVRGARPLRLDCPLTLPRVGQTRDRVYHWVLMVAHSFLAHFDDPFCKPFTSCHRLSVARKRPSWSEACISPENRATAPG